MEEVIGEVLLDDVALVSEADDEVVDALLGVELEDVPEDGLAADLHHGLGADGGFFAETRAETAGENDRFILGEFPWKRLGAAGGAGPRDLQHQYDIVCCAGAGEEWGMRVYWPIGMGVAFQLSTLETPLTCYRQQ